MKKYTLSIIAKLLLFFAFQSNNVAAQVSANQIQLERDKDQKQFRLPEYPGGITQLRRDLFSSLPAMPCIDAKLFAYLSIDENGSVRTASLFRLGQELIYSDADIKTFLVQNTKWKPALYKGNPIGVFDFLVALEDTTFICPQKEPEKENTFAMPAELEITDDFIFVVVEEQAEFPGGFAALMKYIAANAQIDRPKNCNIQADIDKVKIHTKFIIEKDGSVSNIEILKTPVQCPEITAAAKQVLTSSPKWKPGKQGGKIVRVYFNLPFTLILKP